MGTEPTLNPRRGLCRRQELAIEFDGLVSMHRVKDFTNSLAHRPINKLPYINVVSRYFLPSSNGDRHQSRCRLNYSEVAPYVPTTLM